MTRFYKELVSKVGEHEAQVLAFAYHLQTLKPAESPEVCIAASRWILPAMMDATHCSKCGEKYVTFRGVCLAKIKPLRCPMRAIDSGKATP